MSQHIKFEKHFDFIVDEFAPKPTKHFIPDWYKNTEPYTTGRDRIINGVIQNQTIKKCVPFLDALTSGYIITTYVDVLVVKGEDHQYEFESEFQNQKLLPSDSRFIVLNNQSPIDYHPFIQAKNYPLPDQRQQTYPKWLNPWGIRTPKGYSCLFINPMHNPNGIFTILEGIVDTDRYTDPVNLPFILNDKNFEGVIPAGTPIAQVIPFKRDNWDSSVEDITQNKKSNNKTEIMNKLHTKIFGGYKHLFWQKKEYK